MRKVLFLLLFLIALGTANINSQVRIGGDGEPNAAAVLDLNVDDDTNDGTKGLALPRVSLDSDDAILAGTNNLSGMLVYNTGGSLSAGVYFWNGSNWIMGLTDTIPGGGLDKTVDGEVGIKTGGVTSSMILDGTVSTSDLANASVSLGKTTLVLSQTTCTLGGPAMSNCDAPYPAGCNFNNSWSQAMAGDAVFSCSKLTGGARCYRLLATSIPHVINVAFWCFK